MEKHRAIEVSFPVEVEISRQHQSAILDLVSEICAGYEAEHPDRIMWSAGVGDKITVNPLMLEDDEPVPFDSSVFHIECAERERYDTDRPFRPTFTPAADVEARARELFAAEFQRGDWPSMAWTIRNVSAEILTPLVRVGLRAIMSALRSADAPSDEGRAAILRDLDNRRTRALARLVGLLFAMGGEGIDIEGFDTVELYDEAIMALGIEDAESPDIMAGVIAEDPAGHGLSDCIAALRSANAQGSLPDDLRRLVIAAREVAYEDPDPEKLHELDKAVEAFGDRVRWDDEPAIEAMGGTVVDDGEGSEAETYRQMHEIATETLGYPSILEALEACPKADAQGGADRVDPEFECLIYDAHLPSMTVRFQVPTGFPISGGVFGIRRIRTATDEDRARWAHLPDPDDDIALLAGG